MTATSKRIIRVRIRHEADDSPDLSYLGEYSDRPEETHIDRQERGDMGRGEYRYFNAGCGDPEYIEQDYKRAEAYNRGDWGMIGIWAEAEVVLSGGIVQVISSGGLWGIESDSGRDYFNDVAAQELEELETQLLAVGFTADEITDPIADAEWPD